MIHCIFFIFGERVDYMQKKQSLKLVLLSFVFVILMIPDAVKAVDYDTQKLGTISKDNPSIHYEFTTKEDDVYKFTLDVKGTAAKVYFHVENLSGGESVHSYFFKGDIDGDCEQLEWIGLEDGGIGVTKSVPDLNDGGLYSVVVSCPQYSGTDGMKVGICIYCEGFGGKQYEYPKSEYINVKEDKPEDKTSKDTTVKESTAKISLSESSITLQKGKSQKLSVTLIKSLKKKGVTWKSSDKKVVTVSKKGKITAKGYGKATITCTSKKNKKYKATCIVTVEKPVEKIDKTRSELLTTIDDIISKTCNPLYQYKNGKRPSVQNDASGNKIWSVGTSANGVLYRIKAYKNVNVIGNTYCDGWGLPVVTLLSEDGEGVRKEIKNGTYDFKKDPSKLIIGWRMWDSDTTKEEMETMINSKISDEIYEKLLNKYNSYWDTQGSPVVIIYGKNADGKLIGKYAGTIEYNLYSNAVSYTLFGTDSSNKDEYGKIVTSSVKYQ